MNPGFVKIWRKLLDWEWYRSPETKAVFLHLLLTAAYKDTSWQGVEIKRGQILTGRKKLATELGLSEKNIRTCLNRLKLTGEVAIKTANRYSIITICNYDFFQNDGSAEGQQDGQHSGQRTGQQGASEPATYKEDKKVKKERRKKRAALLPDAASPVFFCSLFSVKPEFHFNLGGEFPDLDLNRIYSKLEKYITANPGKYKVRSDGTLEAAEKIIRNWCARERPPVSVGKESLMTRNLKVLEDFEHDQQRICEGG